MGSNENARRLSTGGTAPRKSTYHHARSLVTRDHIGHDVVHAWGPSCFSDTPDDLPPFPFPLYMTSSASDLVPDQPFGEEFASFVQASGGVSDGDDDCRFELYTKRQPTILDCVAHARKEKCFRNDNNIWPSLVRQWSRSCQMDEPRYKGFILVIDKNSWREEGIVFVWFDPRVYDLGEDYVYWSTTNGDHPLVQAVLHRDMRMLGQRGGHLWGVFSNAGGHSSQEVLRKRNHMILRAAPNTTSGTSQTFQTADLLQKFHDEYLDVDDEDNAHQCISGTNHVILEELEKEGSPLRIISSFDRDELLDNPGHERLFTKTYYDISGSQVSSVWNRKYGPLHPMFSVTLYLSDDCPQYPPQGLFRSLNKGLLGTSAWTLDVVYGIPDLENAFRIHNTESQRRSESVTKSLKKVTRLILDKVIGTTLPPELIRCIEDMLLPPQLPDYSGLPNSSYRNMFLYLPEGRSNKGPIIVSSNPASSECDKESVQPELSGISPSVGSVGYRKWQQNLLAINDLRYWHRVANELHIIWSGSAPRATLNGPLPRLRLEIYSPNQLVLLPTNMFDLSVATVSMTLEASHTIAVHKRPLFNLQLLHRILEVVDLTTGSVLPMTPIQGWRYVSHWDQTSQLGRLPETESFGDEESLSFMTLTPGVTKIFTQTSDIFECCLNTWLAIYHQHGHLLDGHKYVMRQCRSDLTIPRWTWGKWNNLEGPYNMPPLPVSIKGEWTFSIKCPKDGGQSHYFCRCHE